MQDPYFKTGPFTKIPLEDLSVQNYRKSPINPPPPLPISNSLPLFQGKKVIKPYVSFKHLPHPIFLYFSQPNQSMRDCIN